MKAQREKLQAERKRQALVLLAECEDRTFDGDIRRSLRRARRQLEGGALAPERAEKALQVLGEVRAALKDEQPALLRVCLSELEALLNAPAPEPPAAAGPLAKLARRLSGREPDAPEARLRRQEAEAEGNVFALEKRIAALIDRRAAQVRQLEALRRQCAASSEDSAERAVLLRQLRRLAGQVRDTDGQLAAHDRLLLDNEKYRALLESGRITFQLRQYLPDPAEAAALLETVERETTAAAEAEQELAALLEAHGDAMLAALQTAPPEAPAAAAPPAEAAAMAGEPPEPGPEPAEPEELA